MRRLYTIILYLLLPFILLRLWIKNYKNPDVGMHWYERLGYYLRPVPKNGIWLHAVSVGESIAAVPLIKLLQQKHPSIPIVVTGETIGGAERIRINLGDSVNQLYAPYDLPLVLNRFFNKVKPRLLILMETELWPNILNKCRKKKIPVLLANARLSERSAHSYRRVLSMTREMLASIHFVLAQSKADADHFLALGFAKNRISIAGNIKFDLELPSALIKKANLLRETWGGDRLVWIAASTHEGEEKKVLKAFIKIRKFYPNALLISAPRHVERIHSLLNFFRNYNFNIVKHSEQSFNGRHVDILLGDKMGELLTLYAASDIAFVGGSLVKKGGQNPIEPAAVGLPILIGPYTFNFAMITKQLQQKGIAIQVRNTIQLADQVLAIFSDCEKRLKIGNKAKKFVKENGGSLVEHINFIEKLLQEK